MTNKKLSSSKPQQPSLQETQPGKEWKMDPKPLAESDTYKASGKLQGKVALISGGDSGIGRAVAIYFAKEGAEIMITYLNEHTDAAETKHIIESAGGKCESLAGNIGEPAFCQQLVKETLQRFGKIDILVNNAAEQHETRDFLEITQKQLQDTFTTNIFSFFYLSQAVLPHLKPGSTIINSTSVTAYKGSPDKIDYSSTKGAIVSFTYSLSQALIAKEIRVNAVAPGPIWTPLIPASMSREKVEKFGSQAPMQRAGQPAEVAPSYVFLASEDSSYMTGQVLHPNGGIIVGG